MATQDNDHREAVLAALVRYECSLVRYATRLLYGNQDKARDAVQHTFMKLCEQRPAKMGDRLAPWLFRVCRNRTIDLLRSESTTETADLESLAIVDRQMADPSDTAESSDMMELVRHLIGRLPMAQQEVIELWSQGFTHNEIAEVVDKSVGAVRGTLHRAIKSLKADEQIRCWLRPTDAPRDHSPAHVGVPPSGGFHETERL